MFCETTSKVFWNIQTYFPFIDVHPFNVEDDIETFYKAHSNVKLIFLESCSNPNGKIVCWLRLAIGYQSDTTFNQRLSDFIDSV